MEDVLIAHPANHSLKQPHKNVARLTHAPPPYIHIYTFTFLKQIYKHLHVQTLLFVATNCRDSACVKDKLKKLRFYTH